MTIESSPHIPMNTIKFKSHELFGEFITKHELPRKIFHSSIGFITIYLYTRGFDYTKIASVLSIAFFVILLLDIIRLNFHGFNWLYCKFVGMLMRPSEINKLNGVLYYILGLIFCFGFFQKDICLITVMLLSWSDTAASTFGRKYGHLTPKIARNKSLAGSLAAFVVGVISVYLTYGVLLPAYPELNLAKDIKWHPETSIFSLGQISLLGGFVASFSEGIDIFNIDDNLTIPVLSSLFLAFVTSF
ncbi:CTP-dependent diacylglycerol kinase 1 [Hanseniaspora uvarum DSM 2768]|nr:CTP-dependent diacylglycerol kinase 1 [Hanseniaspora uvarum DSM 2768]GMM41057.1 diacylglycerol kinase [Hanseniaspora uvarum]